MEWKRRQLPSNGDSRVTSTSGGESGRYYNREAFRKIPRIMFAVPDSNYINLLTLDYLFRFDSFLAMSNDELVAYINDVVKSIDVPSSIVDSLFVKTDHVKLSQLAATLTYFLFE